MIKVEITKKNNYITCVTMKGHANFASHGSDIVCAGVSMIFLTVARTLQVKGFEKKKMCEIHSKSGNIKIDVMQIDETMQVILETLEIGLLGCEEEYGKYIKITYREE